EVQPPPGGLGLGQGLVPGGQELVLCSGGGPELLFDATELGQVVLPFGAGVQESESTGGPWKGLGAAALRTTGSAGGDQAAGSLAPAGPAEGPALVLGEPAPHPGLLAGLHRPFQAFQADLAGEADGLRGLDLQRGRTGGPNGEEQLGIL